MGQIPVSLACLCCNLLSSFYCKSKTSCLVAGVADTDWILLIKNGIPELLFFGGVLSWWKDGVENIFSVRAAVIGFVILG